MARISKPGLDYFPLDVNFFQDRKVRRISNRHHAAGIAALTSLLCLIYKEKGYYVAWNPDTLFDIAQEVCCEEEEMQAIIDDCLSVGLFDTYIYKEYGILTSQAIQEQYHKIITDSRRKYKLPLERFWLIKEEGNGTETDTAEKEIQIADAGTIIGAETTSAGTVGAETASTRTVGARTASTGTVSAGTDEAETRIANTGINAAKSREIAATMPQTKQETDTDIKSKPEKNMENDIQTEKKKDKEKERQIRTGKENGKDIDQPPVPSNGVFQALPVAVGGLSLEISSGRREEKNDGEKRSEGATYGKGRYEGNPYENNQRESVQPAEAPNEGTSAGGISESLLKLNMDAIGIRNEQTVKAILALARRKKLGGPSGTLWKVLSSEYRATLLKKNEPGDYILWALNHPEEFESTYNATLKKRIRGR